MTSRALPALLTALVLTLSGCAAREEGSRDGPAERTAGAPRTAAPVRIVAVGDIACPPGARTTARSCRHRATARLTRSLRPAHVLGLGDLQYDRGTYAAFSRSYDAVWGSLKPITRPLPGNHEYGSPRAAGYYRYFGRKAPGYYAWNAGTWRIYNLNSNCGHVDCAREARWLRRDLARNPRRCTIVAMHHPRWSSGLEHGNTPGVGRFWRIAYDHRVDVALAGHDHDYERFARLDPAGRRDPRRGIQSFVSGAGGKSLYHLGRRQRGSEFFGARAPGVLQLSLGRGAWSWRFRTVDGRTPDAGRGTCR